MRPFLHIRDTSRFIEFLIKNIKESNNVIFNVGDSSNSKSILDMKIFEKRLNKKINLNGMENQIIDLIT